VEADGDWTLLCPGECPGLDAVWGQQFDQLYTQYEQQPHRCRKVIRARELW
jgi:ribonucleotide reductase alpha subunit